MAVVEYSCPAGFAIAGDKCVKTTKAQWRNGFNYCLPEDGVLKGKDCELIIAATATEVEGTDENNNELPSITCPEGSIVHENQCVVYHSSAYERSGQKYCMDGNILIGSGCYTVYKENDGTENDKDESFDIKDDDAYQNIGSATVNCGSLGLFKDDLNMIFKIIKIVAPILVIVFSVYDFIKAAAGKVEGEIKKAFSKLLKRLLFAIILFFLPTVLNYFLSLAIPGFEGCITG